MGLKLEDGVCVGRWLIEGLAEGISLSEGSMLGITLADGRLLGVSLATIDGAILGDCDSVGDLLGARLAVTVGAVLGAGEAVGKVVGDGEGASVAGTSDGGSETPTPSKVGMTQRFLASPGSSIHVHSTGHQPGVASSNFIIPFSIEASLSREEGAFFDRPTAYLYS